MSSPTTVVSPAKEVLSPLSASSWKKEASPPSEVVSPPLSSRREEFLEASRVKDVSLRRKEESPPKNQRSSSLIKSDSFKATISPIGKVNGSPPKMMNSSPPMVKSPPLAKDTSTPLSEILPPKNNNSPPSNALKNLKTESKDEENVNTRSTLKRENSIVREAPLRGEKLSLVATDAIAPIDKTENHVESSNDIQTNKSKDEESNGVGDKIRKFEKAAEDANASAGRLSRPGSVRGRSRDEPPQPATPFKEAAHFDLVPHNSVNSVAARWQRNEVSNDIDRPRPEPQKIIKPEFKPLSSPAEVTIRSPSLGAKIADRFPSHGTAFRNVASPDPARPRETPKFEEDGHAANDFRSCKMRNKERHSVSKGSSYFTRGSEEIWLVKKKDIEEIEERVLDSFRRAGGASSRAPHDAGGTLRARRHGYTRSESLDPQWAGARAHTLKRQASVACTCGHDKKTRAKPADAAAPAPAPAHTPARPRSRSHGDDADQAHVLDKYETLV